MILCISKRVSGRFVWPGGLGFRVDEKPVNVVGLGVKQLGDTLSRAMTTRCVLNKSELIDHINHDVFLGSSVCSETLVSEGTNFSAFYLSN